jgi:hypothetical protein
MGKSRMMGAGSACSTLYGSNVNLKTCGGNKKQGLPFSLDTRVQNNYHIKTKAVGHNRDVVFLMNQLGGVSSSTFSSSIHSYASGDGRSYMMPFICDPYCIQRPLNIIPKNPDIPPVVEATLYTKKLNIFSYSIYDGILHCFTDTSQLDTVDLEEFKVNNQSLADYINDVYGTLYITNSGSIITQLHNALKFEDMNTGNNQLLKRDRVTNKLYSNETTNGFPLNNLSISTQIYNALKLQFPDRILTCPTRNSLLSVGDSFVFTGQFTYNGSSISINFNINII